MKVRIFHQRKKYNCYYWNGHSITRPQCLRRCFHTCHYLSYPKALGFKNDIYICDNYNFNDILLELKKGMNI
jgi:hypothetical protein